MTPAHDPNDFEVGLRHDLPIVRVFTYDGHMTGAADKAAADALFAAGKNTVNEPHVLDCGKYAGMTTLEARKAILADLEAGGFLKEIEPLKHEVGTCYRCHSTIEPMVSKQWFVKMEPLAKPAIESVEKGDIKFVPERFTKNYMNWMKNTRDWCISRQLWWGHQIPAWYCDDCGEMSASRTDLEKCPKCGSTHIHQDEDALDTWFSSALWPFSTMGWPDNTELLKQFYPTSVLVTGYDIIFFWVARMLIMGMEFMKEIPFEKVFIHGLVRDSQGRKMSKSLGNGIDPLEVIEKYGADTLRFMLITGNTPGNDMRFYWERVEGTRNFANKIWNASRFALMNMEGYDKDAELAPYTLADKWILSRLQDTVKDVTGLLERFELGEAGRAIYDFIWSEVCDWYIEIAKPRLYNKEAAAERATAQHVLATVLVSAMKLLHPYMPFITEELWQALEPRKEGESLMVAQMPEVAVADSAYLDAFEIVKEIVGGVRTIRLQKNIPNKDALELQIVGEHNEAFNAVIAKMCNLSSISKVEEKAAGAVSFLVRTTEYAVPLGNLINVEEELAKLQEELKYQKGFLASVMKKLGNENFVSKAPAKVIEMEKKKQADAESKIKSIEESIAALTK